MLEIFLRDLGLDVKDNNKLMQQICGDCVGH